MVYQFLFGTATRAAITTATAAVAGAGVYYCVDTFWLSKREQKEFSKGAVKNICDVLTAYFTEDKTDPLVELHASISGIRLKKDSKHREVLQDLRMALPVIICDKSKRMTVPPIQMKEARALLREAAKTLGTELKPTKEGEAAAKEEAKNHK